MRERNGQATDGSLVMCSRNRNRPHVPPGLALSAREKMLWTFVLAAIGKLMTL